MIKVLEVDNIGPVCHASIPVPEDGGVVVLRGRNGSGKTMTLDAFDNLISGRGRSSVRDGALSGSVSGFGVTIKIARSARRSGELEVTSLEGRLSVAELVDPGLKSPEAADSRRIKALIAVAGMAPNVETFYPLFGGRDGFESIVSSSAVDASDMVTMAECIKRDCEAAARKAESEADHEEGRAKGATEASAVVVDGEDDAEVLQELLFAAIENKSRINEKVAASEEARDAAELSQHRLDKAEKEYNGDTLDACRAAEQSAKESTEKATEAVVRAEQALREAQSIEKDCASKLLMASIARENAERHESTVAKWREQIDSAIPPMPTDEQLEKAANDVVAARNAVERGVMIRAAKIKRKEAEVHAERAKEHRKTASKLRHAAKGTDEVLSSVVSKAGSELKVEAGRLVLETKRGMTYFSELSHGERWRIALDVAIKAVGEGGVIVLKQEAWEGLDPIARDAVVSQVKGSKVVILTAECSAADDVVAEVLS